MEKISVVIPTYNSYINLNILLASLFNQSLDINKYEIIIVDDASTDSTKEIVNKYSKDNINIKYIGNVINTGPGIARNIGVKASDGEIIAFIDSDCIADGRWLETIYSFFSGNKECQVIYGSIYSALPNLPPFIHSFNRVEEGTPGTANLAIKKELFNKFEGFDLELSYWGEDWDLIFRLRENKIKIRYIKDMIVEHSIKYTPFKFGEILRTHFVCKKELYQLKKHHYAIPYFTGNYIKKGIFTICIMSVYLLIGLILGRILESIIIAILIFNLYGLYRVIKINRFIKSNKVLISIKISDAIKFILFRWIVNIINLFICLFVKFKWMVKIKLLYNDY